MERQRLINLVEVRRQAEVNGKSVAQRAQIIEMADAVKAVIGKTVDDIIHPREIFEICRQLDQIHVAPEIEVLFKTARREILSSLLDELADENIGPVSRGEIDKAKARESQKDLWKKASKLAAQLSQLQPDSFGPQWIRENLPDLYLEITASIRNEFNGSLAWEKIIDLLPEFWQARFARKKKLERESRTEEDIEVYRSIAEALGADALAEFLSLIKGKRDKNYGKMLNIVRKYLGKSLPGNFTLRKFAELPEEALQNPNFRKLIFVRLRNKLYEELMQEDGDLDREKAKISKIRNEAAGYIDGFREAHRALMDEISDEFRRVLDIKAPARMKNRIADKGGTLRPFPSLRQRFAMKQLDRQNGGNGKLLVSFFMGGGKTGTAFLAKEHVGAKRMLFVCPKPDLVTQTADRVGKYYRKGEEPTVGTILSGMSQEQIEEEMKKEVVIAPFTMFNSKVNGGTLVDALKNEDFEMMVVDEAHNARNEDGLYSRSIKDLAYGIKGLYDKGYIMLLSGDPVPNKPDDIAAQLGIADREKYAQVESLRAALKRADPLQLRNMLLDFMLILDPPEKWHEYVEAIPLELTDEESAIYNSVLEDETLPASEKIHRLRLALLNPAMIDASFHGTGSMADSIAERMEDDFENENVVVFAEPCYKAGVLRPDEEQPDVPTTIDQVRESMKGKNLFMDLKGDTTPALVKEFVEKAQKQKKTPVLVAVYDGDTPKAERQNIKDISRNIEEMGAKMVIFAVTGPIREGIDLSHINRAYLLAPEFNQPDLAQFVKRFRREGNEQAQIGVFIAPGTITEGIHLHSEQKAVLCDALKYGNVVSQVELRMVDEEDNRVKVNHGSVVFGTHFAGSLLSPASKLRRVTHFLAGKSAAEQIEFLEKEGEKYANLFAKEWEYSESAQMGRLTAAVISDLMTKGYLDKTASVADVASGPLVLANTLGAREAGLTIHSFDLNQFMLVEGTKIKSRRLGSVKGIKAYMSKMDQLTADGVKVEDEKYDCVNLGDALSYTNHSATRKNPAADERTRVLMEQCRVLKTGGILTITLPSNACTPDEMSALMSELGNFGLEVIDEYSGTGKSEEKKKEFECHIIVAKKVGKVAESRLNIRNLQLTPLFGSSLESRSENQIINTFSVKNKRVRFTTPIDEKLKAELHEYEMATLKARQLVQQMLERKGTGKLTRDEKATIKREGIILELPSGGQQFWKFALAMKPDKKHKVYLD